jgi:hypothetical protein
VHIFFVKKICWGYAPTFIIEPKIFNKKINDSINLKIFYTININDKTVKGVWYEKRRFGGS